MLLRWCIDGRNSILLMLSNVNILVKRYTSFIDPSFFKVPVSFPGTFFSNIVVQPFGQMKYGETGQPVSNRVCGWKEISHSEIMRQKEIVTAAT